MLLSNAATRLLQNYVGVFHNPTLHAFGTLSIARVEVSVLLVACVA